jgi:hypothetical protein
MIEAALDVNKNSGHVEAWAFPASAHNKAATAYEDYKRNSSDASKRYNSPTRPIILGWTLIRTGSNGDRY